MFFTSQKVQVSGLSSLKHKLGSHLSASCLLPWGVHISCQVSQCLWNHDQNCFVWTNRFRSSTGRTGMQAPPYMCRGPLGSQVHNPKYCWMGKNRQLFTGILILVLTTEVFVLSVFAPCPLILLLPAAKWHLCWPDPPLVGIGAQSSSPHHSRLTHMLINTSVLLIHLVKPMRAVLMASSCNPRSHLSLQDNPESWAKLPKQNTRASWFYYTCTLGALSHRKCQ